MHSRDRTPAPHRGAPTDAGRSGNEPHDLSKGLLPASAPLPSLTAAFSRRRAIFGAVEIEPGREPPDALVSSDLALAQVRHARRALEGALEHGASLLAALGLPRLVEPNFVPIDPAAAGDAIEAAIAALDAMDAPFHDVEDGHDAEHDTSDAEHCLGWNETVSQLALGRPSDDGDETALERSGRGFIRSGPDDAEDDDPAERDDECGCVEDLGSAVNRLAQRPLTPAEREEVAVLMHRAVIMRRAIHV